jgi:hypothetical protein
MKFNERHVHDRNVDVAGERVARLVAHPTTRVSLMNRSKEC